MLEAARTAIVTGGTSGIGLATAELLLATGFNVTVAARDEARLVSVCDRIGAAGVRADTASEDDCNNLVDAHLERTGRLNVLVNAAGTGRLAQVDATELDVWMDQHNVHARAVFLLTKRCLPALRDSSGLVVSIGSQVATGRVPGLAAYSAAKASVASLMHTVYAENRTFGVRATTIVPGFVDTGMTRRATRSAMPFERMIRPEDCARCIGFLLTLSANAHITDIELVNHGAPSR